MKPDLSFLDIPRVWRRQHAPRAPWREVGGRSEMAMALFGSAGLAMIACGIVAAALWFAWHLAEILP